MKKIQEKINIITEQLIVEEKKDNQKLFLTEMKKIGIEKLPYAYSSLKQFIDAETMEYHYNKHYKGYVDKLNSALSKKDYGDLELEDIIKSIGKYDKTISNNAGGAFNHALFWKMLSPKTQTPNGDILDKIKKDFSVTVGAAIRSADFSLLEVATNYLMRIVFPAWGNPRNNMSVCFL